ncbi:MAG TPA: hypothetical protein VLC92_13030 [Rhodocyclaceae bacterium]|nr:hypothetical protein [Rhodocyclaceae bacterium]
MARNMHRNHRRVPIPLQEIIFERTLFSGAARQSEMCKENNEEILVIKKHQASVDKHSKKLFALSLKSDKLSR